MHSGEDMAFVMITDDLRDGIATVLPRLARVAQAAAFPTNHSLSTSAAQRQLGTWHHRTRQGKRRCIDERRRASIEDLTARLATRLAGSLEAREYQTRLNDG